MTTEDVKNFIENEDNKNTVKKTFLDLKKFERFLAQKGETRPIHQLEPDHLDEYLANFVLSMRKVDGNEYEPSTIRNIVTSINRKLKRHKYPYNIMSEGPEFQLTRDALKAKQKSLKKSGKGNKPKEAQPITDEEIEIMYQKNILGNANPSALLHSMWFNNTIHFGLRGTKENYNLRWGDIKLKCSADGTEYLELRERQTKTRTGENIADVRKVPPRIFSTSLEDPCRDPVQLYKLYAQKRPANFSDDDHPFYISARTVPITNPSDQWFTKTNVGEKKIASMLKTMASQAEIGQSKRITNHSARKHLVQKLRDSGVAPTDIMQISGHKNIQSIITYSAMSEKRQKECSNLLSSTMSTQKMPATATITSPVEHNTENVPSGQNVGVGATPEPATPLYTVSVAGVDSCVNDNTTVSLTPGSVSTAPVNVQSLCIRSSNQQYVQSLFAGATLNINNFNMYPK